MSYNDEELFEEIAQSATRPVWARHEWLTGVSIRRKRRQPPYSEYKWLWPSKSPEAQQRYREDNRPHIRAVKRACYHANIETARAKGRQKRKRFYRAHRASELEKAKAYYGAHRAAILAKAKARYPGTYASEGKRRCSVCHQAGHNMRRCPAAPRP